MACRAVFCSKKLLGPGSFSQAIEVAMCSTFATLSDLALGQFTQGLALSSQPRAAWTKSARGASPDFRQLSSDVRQTRLLTSHAVNRKLLKSIATIKRSRTGFRSGARR